MGNINDSFGIKKNQNIFKRVLKPQKDFGTVKYE